MKYDITQWTVTRVQEHKENYLESRLDSDICLLSRCRHHHLDMVKQKFDHVFYNCLLYTSPSPRDLSTSRMPSSA